jgi:hypothetical protein
MLVGRGEDDVASILSRKNTTTHKMTEYESNRSVLLLFLYKILEYLKVRGAVEL